MFIRSIPQYRRYAVTILLFCSLLSAGACSPADVAARPEPPAAPASEAAAAATEIPLPSPTPLPTATPFVPKATIKIAAHFPLSGEYEATGTDLLRATNLAVQELAGPLNELGYAVEVVPYDDKMDISAAVANARELVADPQILCGVGHYASSVMIQASEVYHKAGLAFISPSNTNPTVTNGDYLEVNRMVGRDDVQGTVGAQFAKAQGFSTIYVIQASADVFKRNGEAFKREADRIGLKVVGILTTDVSDNFSNIVTRVINLKPDAAYFAGTVGQAGPFFREMRAAGYAGALIVMDTNPALAELGGPLLTDGGGTYYTDVIGPASVYAGGADFVKDFDNRYGTSPQPFAAQAYDAAGICLKGIEEAAKANGGELPTRAEVAKAIRALVDYAGITGTYNFNKRGDPTTARYFVYKVVVADSASWAQNQLVATLEAAPPQ